MRVFQDRRGSPVDFCEHLRFEATEGYYNHSSMGLGFSFRLFGKTNGDDWLEEH